MFKYLGDEQGFPADVCELGPFVLFGVLFWLFFVSLMLCETDGSYVLLVMICCIMFFSFFSSECDSLYVLILLCK